MRSLLKENYDHLVFVWGLEELFLVRKPRLACEMLVTGLPG